MNLIPYPSSSGRIVIPFALCLLSIIWATYAKSVPSTVVFSEISPNYHRKMLPTGKYEPETYALGKGICLDSYYVGMMDQMLLLQQMADNERNHAAAYNARLPGYHQELKRTGQKMGISFAAYDDNEELMSEIEHPRYFVILQAYDFQAMWTEKKRCCCGQPDSVFGPKGTDLTKNLKTWPWQPAGNLEPSRKAFSV
jgi:hypothetical protein